MERANSYDCEWHVQVACGQGTYAQVRMCSQTDSLTDAAIPSQSSVSHVCFVLPARWLRPLLLSAVRAVDDLQPCTSHSARSAKELSDAVRIVWVEWPKPVHQADHRLLSIRRLKLPRLMKTVRFDGPLFSSWNSRMRGRLTCPLEI